MSSLYFEYLARSADYYNTCHENHFLHAFKIKSLPESIFHNCITLKDGKANVRMNQTSSLLSIRHFCQH